MIGTTAPVTLPAPSKPEERSQNPLGFVVISAERLSVPLPAGLTTNFEAGQGDKAILVPPVFMWLWTTT